MKVREKKSTIVKFVVMIVFAGFCGAMASRLLIRVPLDTVLTGVVAAVATAYLPVQLLLDGAALWYVVRCVRQSRVLCADPEDEERYDRGELHLSHGMVVVEALMVVSLTGFGVCSIFWIGEGKVSPLLFGLAAFMVSLLLYVVAQVKLVNLTKSLRPEKRGDALEFRFQKDWMASCDEAERAQIGEACYASFLATQYAILAAWVVAVVAGVTFGQGVLPVVLLGAVWAVHKLAYYRVILQRKAKPTGAGGVL